MVQGLEFLEENGSPAGIDQSEKPRAGSIYDARNISSNNEFWTNRPGLQSIASVGTITGGAGTNSCNMLAEYIPDRRFVTSKFYAMLVARTNGTTQAFGRLVTPQSIATITPTDITFTADKGLRFSTVNGLFRYAKGNGDIDYTPCIAFTNGVDRPAVYHQKDTTETVEALDSVDGGDSSLTYLAEPPKANFYIMFKSRLFAFKGNRVWHTGPDSSGVWAVNVWPAAYNFDVGDGGDVIVGARVFSDRLVIFKERSIWVLSGDGVGGMWQLDQEDGVHGALSHFAIEDVGDSLIFLAKDAVYRWAGGAAKNISHPRLRKLWGEYSWAEADGKRFYSVFDSANKRVIFAVGTHTDDVDSALVYNVEKDSWDAWGAWPDQARDIAPYGFPEWGIEARGWDAANPSIIGVYKGYVCKLHGDHDRISTADYAIHWYIRTQRYWATDSESMLGRRAMVNAKKTGDWQMAVLMMKEDETLEEAIKRGTGSKYNLIIDSTNSVTHNIGSTTAGANTFTGDEAVDLIFLPMNYNFADRIMATAQPANAYQVELTVAANSTDMSGLLGIILDGTNPTKFITMYNTGDPMYDDAGTTWDDFSWSDPGFEKITVAANVIGKDLSLWLSNVGSYSGGAGYDYAKLCSKLELQGWGIWAKRRKIRRQ